MKSQYLSSAALKSLNRIGDIMIPEGEGFPSFSQLGCIEHIDAVVAHAPPADIKDLGMLMGALSLCPTFLLRIIVSMTENAHHKTGGLAPTLRLLNAGLRGILFTLYYSGKRGASYAGPTPLDLIGFELNRVPRD